MRNSRLVGATISVATVAAIAVPVASQTAAQAVPTVAAVGATVTAPPPLTPEQARAAKLAARHVWAVDMRSRLVAYAKSKLRRGQYVAGASSEWRFDCSGFTKQIYRKVAHINIPHYSGAQLNMRRGQRVSKKNLLPGDLLLWGSNGSQHASMYIGRGKMIGANNPRRDVVIEPIHSGYWSPRYAGARRLIIG